MKTFCIYTKQINESVASAKECQLTGKKFDVDVELYPSVFYKDVEKVAKQISLKMKYKPNGLKWRVDFKNRLAPATRIANGITHYLLYKWCVEYNEPICILEHDARIKGYLPKPINNAIIQINSQHAYSYTPKDLFHCNRADKARKYGNKKEFESTYNWDWPNKGIIKHPLPGFNGTMGYIIDPIAAQTVINYIEEDGVGFADRIRKENLGDILYLLIPQVVFRCEQNIDSLNILRKVR